MMLLLPEVTETSQEEMEREANERAELLRQAIIHDMRAMDLQALIHLRKLIVHRNDITEHFRLMNYLGRQLKD